MKVKEVVSLFKNDPALNLLLAKISEPQTNIKLKGLVGSSDALNLLISSEKIEQPSARNHARQRGCRFTHD